MKADLDHVLFTSAYLLCLVDALIFGYSTFGNMPYAGTLSVLLRICAAVLILTKLILDRRYSLGLLLRLIAVGLVFLIVYIKSRYSHIFYLLIICLGIWNVDEKAVASLDFWFRMVMCLLIVVCALTGIIENYITYRTSSDVLRYSIGFNHPNTVASIVLSLILEEAWLNQRRGTGFYTVVIWIIAAITYLITANRTAVLIMLVFPLALLFIREGPAENREKRHGSPAFASLLPAAVIFSCLAMLLCRSSFLFRSIDAALSNRFYNAGMIYNAYGVPLLGQQVALVSVKTARLTKSSIALLDVAYLRLLIQAGPVILTLVVILYASAMNRAWKEQKNLLTLIFAFYVVFGLCESGFNNVFMNFTLLMAAKELFAAEQETGG